MMAPALPREIEVQYALAVERTGETPQLIRARIRIAMMLAMHPAKLEELMAGRYIETV